MWSGIYILLFSQQTQKKRKMSDVYFLTVFEVLLWGHMNNSTVFIQLRIKYLLLLSLLPLSSSSNLTLFLLSPSSSAPVYLTICLQLTARLETIFSQFSLNKTATAAEKRACECLHWYIVCTLKQHQTEACQTQHVLYRATAHTGAVWTSFHLTCG